MTSPKSGGQRAGAKISPNGSVYSAKPWLALYPDEWPTQIEPAFGDMLSMFRNVSSLRRQDVAVRYFDGSLTFDDLDRLSDAMAVGLARHGIVRGDRVAVVLQNVPQFMIFVIAAWKCGAIPVPGNPMYRSTELAKIFRDCAPKVVLVHDDQFDVARQAIELTGLDAWLLSTSAHEFQTRGDPRIMPPRLPVPAGADDFMRMIGDHLDERPDPIALKGDEIGLLPYTSGTTGQPKGTMLRHAGLSFNAESSGVLSGVRPDSRVLAIAPFFHITGFTCHFGVMLSAGCSLILHSRVIPAVVLDAIREHKPTYTVGAITAFNALISDANFRKDDFRSLERAASGGAPVPHVLRERIAHSTGLWIETGYGMTETSAQTVYAPPGRPIPVDPTSGALSIGIPTPSTEILIVDENGEPLPVGETGELWTRGPQVMAGYWQKPDETAATLYDGWLRSGDVALMDRAGWIYLVDRQKDVIIASGFKVWPREVEDVLYSHPAIREAAVVGVPDDYRGETVKAYVSLKAGRSLSGDELLAFCRERLAGYKQPRLVTIVDELPKTVTGKIQRNLVRDWGAP